MPSRAGTVGEITSLLEQAAQRLEAPPLPFSLLEHSLQCAAVLSTWAPDDRELQLAGLLHDIGHLLVGDGPDLHGVLGAELVRPLLGERVAALVALHVEAKRYLVSIDPSYRATLTMGSAESLLAQGDVMSTAELARFRAEPHGADACVLRRADEAAKQPGRAVPPLAHWVPLLDELARRRRAR
ncbi:MAG: HD domain-containing protein [Actinomycetota bacterium]|nr:HD domain-containing protein [Actinomycetota bacterium]